jgi:hypothetical protein
MRRWGGAWLGRDGDGARERRSLRGAATHAAGRARRGRPSGAQGTQPAGRRQATPAAAALHRQTLPLALLTRSPAACSSCAPNSIQAPAIAQAALRAACFLRAAPRGAPRAQQGRRQHRPLSLAAARARRQAADRPSAALLRRRSAAGRACRCGAWRSASVGRCGHSGSGSSAAPSTTAPLESQRRLSCRAWLKEATGGGLQLSSGAGRLLAAVMLRRRRQQRAAQRSKPTQRPQRRRRAGERGAPRAGCLTRRGMGGSSLAWQAANDDTRRRPRPGCRRAAIPVPFARLL